MEPNTGYSMSGARQAAARVLLAEDNAVIALDVQSVLEDAGYLIVGPCTSCADVFARFETERPDVALLDVELADGSVLPAAETLAHGGVPFAVMTGFESMTLEGVLGTAPVLAKPFRLGEIERVVAGLLHGRDG